MNYLGDPKSLLRNASRSYYGPSRAPSNDSDEHPSTQINRALGPGIILTFFGKSFLLMIYLHSFRWKESTQTNRQTSIGSNLKNKIIY